MKHCVEDKSLRFCEKQCIQRCRGDRWKSAVSVFLLTLTAIFLVPFATATALGANKNEVRRVLIFDDFSPLASPGIRLINHAIFSGLEHSPYQIELYNENLEATLFADEASQRAIRDWFFRKYQDRKPDVIITVGPASLKFMIESHESFAPNVPVIFSGSTVEMLEQLKPDSHFTGVWGVAQPEKTLNVALRLQPFTQHVVVVGGVGPYERKLEAIARESLKKYETKLDVTYLTELDMPALLERLRHLPRNAIIYYTAITQDAAGKHFIDATQSVPMVAAAANAPVFIVDDVDLGTGAVGGYSLSLAAEGETAADLALRVLNGEKPKDIPAVKSANVYMFDSRALKRWGLHESALPSNSIVLNRQPSVRGAMKWYIIGGIVLIALEALLIFGLVWHRTKRRKAESELGFAYDRLRLAVESGRAVGWDWDLKRGRSRWFGDLQTMFGIPSDDHVASIGEFQNRVHPDDRKRVAKAIEDSRRERNAYNEEFRVVRDDQTVRWITARGKFYYGKNGDAELMLGTAVDITDRKRMEQKVRESEQRFRLVANTAPIMIWMSGPDKLCNYFNQPWLDFTGRPLDAELGNGWTEGVNAEDLEGCLQTYTHAFERRDSFEMQYRLRRHDGQYRWILDMGVPRFDSDGSFAGYIGSCLDVTDRKLAEEALASVGRRLIEAHEEERTRIGRELHDDISQRLVLVAIELDRWNQKAVAQAAEFHDRLGKLKKQVSDISDDVRTLSHRLHSSQLEYLGLALAAETFCKELAEQRDLEIDFSQSGLPRRAPNEISLCLFRVLQEALQNAMRHSGVRHFRVTLQRTSGGIQLVVSDDGVGFDDTGAICNRGLGLISMRERLQLVNGEISIESQPGRGTTITALVPLDQQERRLQAA